MKKYIVRDGDTMWEISQATGVRLNLLMAANPQVKDPKQLQPGSLIVIPELGKQGQKAGPTTSPASHPTNSVGPNTPAVAGSPQTKLPTSAKVNVEPPSMPHGYAGPEYYFGFVWPHVVTAGETWESIGSKYGVPLTQLKRMNPEMSAGDLSAGTVVYVPSPSTPTTPTTDTPGGQSMGPGVVPAQMPPQAPLQAAEMQQDIQGPHTHYPYRVEYPMPPSSASPQPLPAAPHYVYHGPVQPVAAWYNDWEESSAWDVDDQTDGSMPSHD